MQLKALIWENPQDFVSFVLEGAIVLGQRQGEFQTREMRSDTLFECLYKQQKVLVNVELQVKKEEDIGERLLAYCFEARRKYTQLIYACVIYLKHVADPPQPPLTWGFPEDRTMLWFDYLSIEIAEMEADDLRRRVHTGTSPLLLLSKGGATRETLDQIVQQFEKTKKAESLNITRLIAGMIFTSEADLHWIERRFANMHDFLWENSWTYRQSVQQGMELGIKQGIRDGIEQGIKQGTRDGIEKGIREDIELFVQTRYPALVELARERIAQLQGETELRELLVAMYMTDTEQKAQNYLLGQ